MGLRIGVVLRFKNPAPWFKPWPELYQDHLSYAAAVDRLDFDGIWVPEHHCIETGYNPAPFVTLAAIAGVTRQCLLGTQPLLMPLHNPVLAAEQAAAVDVLSNGRLILGLGGGFRDEDFTAVGISKRERGARSEEAIAIITRAMRGERFDFTGRYYDVKDVQLFPPPVRKAPEFQLAVRSAVVAKRAVRHRVDVNLQSVEEARVHGPAVVAEARTAGIDPATIRASVQRIGYIGNSREHAVEASKPYLRYQMQEYLQNAGDDPVVLAHAHEMITTVERGEGAFSAGEWIGAISGDAAEIRAIGLKPDWINLTLWHSGMPVDEAIEALELFAAEVLPELRRIEA